MPISRRQFLIAAAGATAVAAGVGTPLVYLFVQQVRDLPLPDAAPRTLALNARQAMTGLAEAVFINYSIDLNRYESYFVFHAENLPGYCQLYEDLTAELDAAARYAYGLPFASCRLSARRAILTPWLDMPSTRLEKLTTGVTRGVYWLTYARYVFGEILELFMHTDAWIAVGYDGWPGMPRGLDAYRQPLPVQTEL